MRNDIIKLVARVACLLLIGTAALAAEEQRTQSTNAAAADAKRAEARASVGDSSVHGLSSRPATGEQINWQVISSGGGSGASANYRMAWIVGQTAVGSANSDNFSLYVGFWQVFGELGCCQPPTAGNVDCEGIVDIGDVTELIALLFIRVGDPFCCETEADLDYNGDIDIGDLTILINRLFISVTDPPPCP